MSGPMYSPEEEEFMLQQLEDERARELRQDFQADEDDPAIRAEVRDEREGLTHLHDWDDFNRRHGAP